jgi:hypothetical protein
MPSRNGWIIDNMAVYAQVSGYIDRQAFLEADKQLNRYLDESNQDLVHFIFDYTGVTRVPPIMTQSQATIARHPRFGWALVFGSDDRIMRFLTSVSAQLFKTRFRMLDSFADVEAHLRTVYPDLPAFKPFDDIVWEQHIDWDEDDTQVKAASQDRA